MNKDVGIGHNSANFYQTPMGNMIRKMWEVMERQQDTINQLASVNENIRKEVDLRKVVGRGKNDSWQDSSGQGGVDAISNENMEGRNRVQVIKRQMPQAIQNIEAKEGQEIENKFGITQGPVVTKTGG